MRRHVAIIDPRLVGKILDGSKTIESRLSRTRRAPFGHVSRGDEVYFKARGGGFVVAARVSGVVLLSGLTRAGVRAVRRTFGERIGADVGYWRTRAGATFATLVFLEDARAVADGPRYRPVGRRPSRHGWFVLRAA